MGREPGGRRYELKPPRRAPRASGLIEYLAATRSVVQDGCPASSRRAVQQDRQPAFIGRVRPVGERDRVLYGSVPHAYRESQSDPACGHTPRAGAGPTWQSGLALALSARVSTILAWCRRRRRRARPRRAPWQRRRRSIWWALALAPLLIVRSMKRGRKIRTRSQTCPVGAPPPGRAEVVGWCGAARPNRRRTCGGISAPQLSLPGLHRLQRHKKLCPILGAEWERRTAVKCGQKGAPCTAGRL